MLGKDRDVWVYMCLVEWVGLVHLQNTQDPHTQSTCYYSIDRLRFTEHKEWQSAITEIGAVAHL